MMTLVGLKTIESSLKSISFFQVQREPIFMQRNFCLLSNDEARLSYTHANDLPPPPDPR